MKRLTKSGGSYCDNCSTVKDEFCSCDDEIAMYKKLSEYEDTGFEPNEIRRWISVKDRLPEADECVLLVEKLSENNLVYTTIRYRNLRNKFVVSWNGDEYRFSDIDELYWMPLPEPPKEEANE